MENEKKKKSWLKNQVIKVQVLPWYWKIVATVFIFFIGGSAGSQLFTYADDIVMILGAIVLVGVLWFLIQMWMPAPDND